MQKLKIYTFPNPVLRRKAQWVDSVDSSLWKLADAMLETMYAAPGVGLAANQVGVLKRIFVIDVEFEIEELNTEVESKIVKNKKPVVIINPKIIYREGTQLYSEGCLSIPGFFAEVKRAEKLKLQYWDLDGKTQELHAEGLFAVAIQHELDHLEGRLFIDYLSPLKKEMIKKKLQEIQSISDRQEE